MTTRKAVRKVEPDSLPAASGEVATGRKSVEIHCLGVRNAESSAIIFFGLIAIPKHSVFCAAFLAAFRALHPLAYHCGLEDITIGHRPLWIEPELILSHADLDRPVIGVLQRALRASRTLDLRGDLLSYQFFVLLGTHLL